MSSSTVCITRTNYKSITILQHLSSKFTQSRANFPNIDLVVEFQCALFCNNFNETIMLHLLLVHKDLFRSSRLCKCYTTR